jgi:limonene-1,2-epoxide hydrolase
VSIALRRRYSAARGHGMLPRIMTEIETVQAFLTALATSDVDRALALVGSNIVYQNVPLPPARGMVAFEKQMRFFAKIADTFEVKTHHIAANGPIVLTERTDAFIVQGARAEFWVCGTFEVRDGRIVLWRDYCDWLAISAGTLLALPRVAFATIASGARRVTRRA